MTDASDPTPPTGPASPPVPAFDGRELEVDLTAFLPEGTSLGEDDGPSVEPADPADAADAADGADTDTAHPGGADGAGAEIGVADAESADASRSEADGPFGPGDDVPAAPASGPAVDLAVLSRIEQELAAVDDALLAIDAGDPGRSPLLVALRAEGEAPAGGPPPGDARPSS